MSNKIVKKRLVCVLILCGLTFADYGCTGGTQEAHTHEASTADAGSELSQQPDTSLQEMIQDTSSPEPQPQEQGRSEANPPEPTPSEQTPSERTVEPVAEATPEPTPQEQIPPEKAPTPPLPKPHGTDHMKLEDFNGAKMPVNHAGGTYPSQYPGAGKGTVHLDSKVAVFGKSLRLDLQSGVFYAQFNPRLPAGRDFARDYSENPKGWKYNTYNRFSFWIKMPKEAMPPSRKGVDNMHFGTYVKRIKNADKYSDEAGGGHWYHHLNIPNTDTWTKVIINMHPNHERGASGGKEHGNQPNPTKESQYNYFDTLTRFYISQQRKPPTKHPSSMWLDEFYFYRVPHKENDAQVYSIAATYIPSTKKLMLTWGRNKNENKIEHCVKYAFSDIHTLGWDKAKDAPSGCIKPPGYQGYNKMHYETTQINIGQNKRIFFAIRPKGSKLFSQIDLPILP